MIKDLIKLASHLDKKGLSKEADILDSVIKKMAQQDSSSQGIEDTLAAEDELYFQNYDPRSVSKSTDEIQNLERKFAWHTIGLTPVDSSEEEAIINYAQNFRGRKRGLYCYNNGSYVIIPHTPGMTPLKYTKRSKDGPRPFSGLRHEDAVDGINKVIKDFSYTYSDLPVPNSQAL